MNRERVRGLIIYHFKHMHTCIHTVWPSYQYSVCCVRWKKQLNEPSLLHMSIIFVPNLSPLKMSQNPSITAFYYKLYIHQSTHHCNITPLPILCWWEWVTSQQALNSLNRGCERVISKHIYFPDVPSVKRDLSLRVAISSGFLSGGKWKWWWQPQLGRTAQDGRGSHT